MAKKTGRNIYDLNLEKIALLYKEGDRRGALALIEEELGMPYTPREYLPLFKSWQAQLTAEIRVHDAVKTKGKGDFLDQLGSRQNEMVLEAITALHNYALNDADLACIKPLLADPKAPLVYKALLFQVLIDQKIDADLLYQGVGRHTLNPVRQPSVRQDAKFVETVSDLERALAKNPSAREFAMQFCVFYYMALFPQTAPVPAGVVARAIIDYTNHVLEDKSLVESDVTRMLTLAIAQNTGTFF